MHESALNDVVARTDFLTSTDTEDAPSFVLHIGRPVLVDEGDWQCSHQITGQSGEDRVLTAYGVDSLQALCLCLTMARARLFEIERRLGTRLLGWDGESIGLSQMPPSTRRSDDSTTENH